MSELTTTRRSSGYLDRPQSSSLADVINIILDKGLVIDVFVRVSVVGIELITIDARIVIASVDTFLRFAEATNRLDLSQTGGKDLTDLTSGMMESGASGKTRGVLQGAKDAIFGSDSDDQDEDTEEESEQEPVRKKAQARPRQRTAARKEQS
jgi:gas vesicle structural protein